MVAPPIGGFLTNDRTPYLRWVEYFLSEVGHEDGTFAGDVGQSSHLAASSTNVRASLLMMMVLMSSLSAELGDAGKVVVVVVLKVIDVIAAFRRTGSVVCRVRACTCSVLSRVSGVTQIQKVVCLP